MSLNKRRRDTLFILTLIEQNFEFYVYRKTKNVLWIVAIITAKNADFIQILVEQNFENYSYKKTKKCSTHRIWIDNSLDLLTNIKLIIYD